MHFINAIVLHQYFYTEIHTDLKTEIKKADQRTC